MNSKARATVITAVMATMIVRLTSAQLELIRNDQVQTVFGGRTEIVQLIWHNAGGLTENAQVSAKIVQASSATTVAVGETPGIVVRVLPGQTVIETAAILFPPVRAETRFLIQWVEETNRVLGVSDILVYPTNLLQELKPLSGNSEIGVFDPKNELKPLLQAESIDFIDLESTSLTEFQGKLAVLMLSVETQEKIWLQQIKQVISKRVGVVYIEPSHQHGGPIRPTFYSVLGNQAALVIVQPQMLSGLSEDPQSQLNLIQFCRLARNPTLPALPELQPGNTP